MQKLSAFSTDDEPTELPPGFRFHPTDEELITHYLCPKVLDSSFTTKALGEVDLNKVEPWDLPWKVKVGEKERYFFCVRDRKYPTGLRINRATDAGYWKATGKDKEIIRDKILVGLKKTLVFYRGRAPRGEKTDWVMHEYRLEGQLSMRNLSKPAKNEWVVCRIFKKSLGVKKVHMSGLVRSSDSGAGSLSSDLPPLTDFSSDENHSRKRGSAEGSSSKNYGVSPFPFEFSKVPTQNSISDSVFLQDHSIVRLLLENNVPDTKRSARAEFSQGFCPDMSYHEMEFKPYLDQEFPTVGTAPVDLGCLWDLDECM